MTGMSTKRVNFAKSPHETIVYQDDLTSNERNLICWYNSSELYESRLEAKQAIQTLLLYRGNVDKAEEGVSGISFRGVEKYGNAQLRELKKTKLLVQSVLLRQTEHARRVKLGRMTVCLKEELASVSKRLSAPCTTLAHFHASKCFQEDSRRESGKREYLQFSEDARSECVKRRRIALSSSAVASCRPRYVVHQCEVTARKA